MNIDKTSPSLERFLKRLPAVVRDKLIVIVNEDNQRKIGYFHEDDFIGRDLQQIICGCRTKEWCYSNIKNRCTVVPDFLSQYKQHGICYTDPDHFGYPNRWEVSEDQQTRTCIHCGLVEYRKVKIVEQGYWSKTK